MRSQKQVVILLIKGDTRGRPQEVARQRVETWSLIRKDRPNQEMFGRLQGTGSLPS